jgi:myo-inositol-1(or 4)-monophosphatase
MKYFDVVVQTLLNCRGRVLECMKYSSYKQPIRRNVFGDEVKLIDLVAEKSIVESLGRYFSNATIISEESGEIIIGCGGPPYVVVDPIDGSVNAVRGYPCFSTSIAIAEGVTLSSVVAGGVMNIVNGDIYYAEKGCGAYLNGEAVRVSGIESIGEALISADLNVKGRIPGYIARISSILEKAAHVRFLGTDALEVCLVASGAADAFIDLRGFLRSTDLSASVFIVREAGGVVADADGNDLEISIYPPSTAQFIASSTRSLLHEIIGKLRDYEGCRY